MASNSSSGMASNSSSEYSSVEEMRDWIVLSLYLLTSIVALIGNLFVCKVIYTKKQFRSTTYILIVNMAISDIVGALVIPGQWLFCSTYILDSGATGQRFCGTFKSLQILSYYVSTFSMTAIAIDRYKLVCHPLSQRIRPLVPLIVIWALGCLFTSTTLFSMRVSEYFSPVQGLIGCRVLFETSTTYELRRMRVVLVMLTQYVIPLAVTGYLYGMVMYTIWKREKVGTVSTNKKESLDETKKRTIKMLIIVVVLFSLAWFPTHLMHFLKFYTNIIPVHLTKYKCNASTFYMLCYWLGISSCAYNPFIYCYFNADFKFEAIRYWNAIFPCFKIEKKLNPKKQENNSDSNPTSSFTETKV